MRLNDDVCCMQGYLLQMLAMKLGVATSMHLAQHCRWISCSSFACAAPWMGCRLPLMSASLFCITLLLERVQISPCAHGCAHASAMLAASVKFTLYAPTNIQMSPATPSSTKPLPPCSHPLSPPFQSHIHDWSRIIRLGCLGLDNVMLHPLPSVPCQAGLGILQIKLKSLHV